MLSGKAPVDQGLGGVHGPAHFFVFIVDERETGW
jgi:hypothetical protein